jgi:hypothetical protein
MQLRKESLLLTKVGSTDVGLLSVNHNKINLIIGEDLLLNEGVAPLLWITSYTVSLQG